MEMSPVLLAKETFDIFNPALPDTLGDLPGETFLQKLLRTGVSFILVVGSIIFFFVLLTGGIKWITAGGDKAKLEGAQKQITHALIGLGLLLSTFVIIQLIESLFGVSLLNITLPTL